MLPPVSPPALFLPHRESGRSRGEEVRTWRGGGEEEEKRVPHPSSHHGFLFSPPITEHQAGCCLFITHNTQEAVKGMRAGQQFKHLPDSAFAATK